MSRSAPTPGARSSEPTLVLLAFSLLAIVWTWPVAAHLSSRVPHDAGDPLLNIWILWWNAQAVPLTERWWSPAMMWPMPGAMALSEHLLGLSLVATPLQLAGASVLTAHNVVLLLTYALCGFANFGSLGIMIGGLGTMSPERRKDVVDLGIRSIVAGTLATCLTAATVALIL